MELILLSLSIIYSGVMTYMYLDEKQLSEDRMRAILILDEQLEVEKILP